MQVKTGDRFKIKDAQCGVRFGTIKGGMEESNPSWPMVPALLDGPDEKNFLADVTQVELVQPLWQKRDCRDHRQVAR